MGTSYSTSRICGYKLEIRDVNKPVTKYNPDNGEPFQKDEVSHREALVHGVVVATDIDDPDAFCSWEKIDGLRIDESGYEDGQKFLGVEVTGLSIDEKDFDEVSLEIPATVKAFEAKHKVTPKHYVFMSCG